MYLHRQLLHLPVALNLKELVGDLSIAVLMATFPHTPSFSYLSHPHPPISLQFTKFPQEGK